MAPSRSRAALDAQIEELVERHGVDRAAEDALRAEPEEVIKLVLQKGIKPGARNPSALIMTAIKSAKEGAAANALGDELRDFIKEYRLDEKAEEALWAATDDVQRWVLEDCRNRPGTSRLRNPSAVVMSLLKQAAKGEENAWRAEDGEDGFGKDDRFERLLRDYIERNELDRDAEDKLRAASEEEVQWLMNKGDIKGPGIRNPSAALMSRLAEVRREVQSERMAKADDHRGGGRQWASSRASDSEIDQRVTDFLEANYIDEEAGAKLRRQSAEVIEAVLAEGKVTGKNQNAVLLSRIRRCERDWREGGSGGDAQAAEERWPPAGPRSGGEPPICTFFLKGTCKYGANCRKRHVQEEPPEPEPMQDEGEDAWPPESGERRWTESDEGAAAVPVEETLADIFLEVENCLLNTSVSAATFEALLDKLALTRRKLDDDAAGDDALGESPRSRKPGSNGHFAGGGRATAKSRPFPERPPPAARPAAQRRGQQAEDRDYPEASGDEPAAKRARGPTSPGRPWAADAGRARPAIGQAPGTAPRTPPGQPQAGGRPGAAPKPTKAPR